MRKLIVLFFLGLGVLFTQAETQVTTDNYVLDEYFGELWPLHVKRLVRGGTVFKVTYGEGCDYEVQGAFSHACKILEEQLESCMPITVHVEFGKIRKSVGGLNQISSITPYGMNADDPIRKEFTFFPKIKWTAVKEQETGAGPLSYMKYIPDEQVFDNPNTPDIKIIYNKDLKDDMSFTIASDSTALVDKYDFVSLALRDLVKGLGLICNYTKAPEENSLVNPTANYPTAFEYVIDECIDSEDPQVRFEKATQGSLDVTKGLSLYAPSSWMPGMSLNYFINTGDGSLPSILRYDFGRGMVNRHFDNTVFPIEILLKYTAMLTTGAGSGDSDFIGDNSHVFSLDGDSLQFLQYIDSIQGRPFQTTRLCEPVLEPLADGESVIPSTSPWCYNCFAPGGPTGYEGVSISFLKKDGTWDVVHKAGHTYLDYAFILRNRWEFHFDNEDYARSPDGYLRGRATRYQMVNNPYPMKDFKVIYFVLDYLPQKVEFELDELPASYQNRATSNSRTIQLKFKNTEGLTRLVIEKLIDGRRLPSKYTVNDFKKGFYNLTMGMSEKATFTIVSYNNKGSSRSESIYVDALTEESLQSLSFELDGDYISLTSDEVIDYDIAYSIMPLQTVRTAPLSGVVCPGQRIGVSSLSRGLYVLKAMDSEGRTHEFKFMKSN